MADVDGQIVLGLEIAQTTQLIQSQLNQLSRNLSLLITGKLDYAKTSSQLKKDLKNLKENINLLANIDKAKLKKDIQAAVSEIKVAPKIDISALQKQIEKVSINPNVEGNGELQQMGDNLASINKKSAATVASVGLLNQAFRTLQSTAKQMIRTAAELDQQLTDLRMVTGQNYEDASRLVDSYNALAKELGATTSQVVDAADEWLRQGESIAEVEQLIAQSMVLSKVGKMDSADATKNLTSAMKGYGLAVDEVSGIVDKLTAIDLQAAVSSSDLAIAMSKTASGANIAGISMDRLLGYLATIQEVTQKSAETVGTSVQSIIARINNIKIGKFIDDESGEALNDTEKILNKFGIALRNTDGEFRAVSDVLDDVYAKWGSLTTVEKSAIATAAAGTRQRENFLTLMNNYGKALEYAEVATNSEGTAMKKFAAYQESVEAHFNTLIASAEALSKQTFPPELLNGFIDAGAAVLDFLEATNLLTIALSTLGTALTMKGLGVFGGKIKSIYQSVTNLSAVFDILSKSANVNLSTEQFNKLLTVTKGLNAQQLKLVVSNKALTTEQRIAILTTSGLTEQEAQQTLTTMGLVTAEGAATTATFSLSGAFKALGAAIAANPIGFLVMALTTAVTVISTVNSKLAEARQEMIDTGNEAAEHANNLIELANSYLTLADAVDAGTAAKEDMLAAQDDIIKALGLEGQSIDELIAKYGDLKTAIKTITMEQLDTDISQAIKGATAAKQSAASDLETFLGTGTITSNKNKEKTIIKWLYDQGLTSSKDIVSLPHSDMWDAFSNPSFEDLRRNRDFLEQAMNAVRKEFGADNDIFAALSEAYDNYADALDPAVEAIDNANRLIEQYYVAAAKGIDDPKTKKEFEQFKKSIIEQLSTDFDFDKNGSFSAEGLLDSILQSDRLYSQFYDNVDQTLGDIEDSINSHSDNISNTISSTIEALAEAEKKIGGLSSALGDFKENGFVTSEALKGLTETFGSLDSFEDFVKVLGNSKSSMKDAQKACNDLAKEFIDSTGILDNLNASNAGVIETFLKSIGVVNAREVVQARLNAVEYESMLAAEGLADAEWAVAERTLLAKIKSLEAVEAFKRLRQEQYNAKLAALDLNTATAATIGTLIQQAKAAGAAANSISALSTLQNIVQGGYAKYAGSGLTEKGYQALLENARRAAQIDLSDISNVTVPTVNVPTPKSSSSKKTKTAAEKLEEQLKELEDSFNNTLSGFEHQIFMLEKKGAAGISNAAISGLREALDYYNSELKDAIEKGFDVSKTVYGNIDTNNRQILEWTDDNLERFKSALESWGTTVDEMRGSISTVFGSSEEFDGIEIAFSPILQTKNGPALLDSDTVREYIWSLIDNAGEGWTTEQLLKLDTQGLEFDGRIIKNLLADIGDTAIQTGEAMHYVGELGSIKQAYNELENLAKSAGLSARELSQAVLDGDFGDSLTNKTKRTANRIVDIYEQMQAAVQKQEELYRSMGLDENSKYIQNLQKQWWEYKDSIKEVITESYEYIRKEHENAISVNENWLEQAITKNNRGDITKYTGEIVDHYRAMQEEIRHQADFYRSLGYADTSDEVSELTNLWWDYYDKIKETSANAWQQVVDNAHDALDQITGLYDTLKNAAKEFAESGYITVSTFQEIAKLGVQNLSYLQDENGLLVINEENIQKVIAARTQQMAVETALNYIQQIREAQESGEIDALNALIFATDTATTSTWDLVYAQLKLLGLSNDQYNSALNNINNLRSLADVAVTSIGKIDGAVEEARKKAYESAKEQASDLDDLLKYVMDMIRQEVKNQVKALEDQVDAFKEIVDLQKESLDLEREKDKYSKTVADKTKELAKLQQQLALLELDDSRESAAKQAKLREELADLSNSLADDQADHAYDATKDMLDDMADAYEREKKKEIEILENTISSEEKVYQLAIERIETQWDTLYQQLIAWNTEYGNVTNNEITSAWNNACLAVQEYGSYLNAVLETQRQIAEYEASSSSSYSYSTGGTSSSNKNPSSAIGVTGNYDTSGSQSLAEVRSIISEMYRNMNEHGGSKSNTSKERKAELSQRNLDLGAKLRKYGINAYRSTDANDYGTWYTSSSKKEKLFEKYSEYIYHTGGIAGDEPTLKQKELFAKLEKGEAVITEKQQEPVYRALDFTETMLGKYGKVLNSISGSDLMNAKMQEQFKKESQQVQSVVTQDNISIENNLTIPVQTLQTLDDSEIRSLTEKISKYTIKELDDVFGLRGKRNFRH